MRVGGRGLDIIIGPFCLDFFGPCFLFEKDDLAPLPIFFFFVITLNPRIE